MRLRIYIIIVFTVVHGFLFGSSVDNSRGDLIMFLDSYQYQGNSDSTFIEVSYSIDLSYLKYIDNNGQYDNMQIAIFIEIDSDGEKSVFAEVAPSGAIRFGPENWLYVCQSWDGTVTRISPDGTNEELYAEVDAALDIDWDASGNTYVLQSWGGGVIRINPSGNQTVVVESGVYEGEIKSCRIFGDYFYFTEIWGSTIWRMDITSSGLENPEAVYVGDSPVGIEIDENGTVYFTEAWEETLYTLNPADGSVEGLFGGELMTPMRYLNFVDKIIYIVYPGWGDVGEVMSVFIGIPQAPGPDYTSG